MHRTYLFTKKERSLYGRVSRPENRGRSHPQEWEKRGGKFLGKGKGKNSHELTMEKKNQNNLTPPEEIKWDDKRRDGGLLVLGFPGGSALTEKRSLLWNDNRIWSAN